MKLIESIKNHPIIYGVGTFLFVIIPNFIEPYWGLISDKPLIPTIIKKIGVINMSNFPWYSYIPLPLGIGIISYLIYSIKKPKSKESKTITTNENHPPSPLEIRFTENQLKYVCVDGDTDNATYTYDSAKYRVAIYNNSKTQTIKNVEARIISIKTNIKEQPYWLIGKLPISLNCNGNEHFNIHAGIDVPVDIVMWQKDTRWEDEEMFVFCANKKLQIPDGDFTISLTVSGEDITSVQKSFMISLNSQHKANLNKISMKEC